MGWGGVGGHMHGHGTECSKGRRDGPPPASKASKTKATQNQIPQPPSPSPRSRPRVHGIESCGPPLPIQPTPTPPHSTHQHTGPLHRRPPAHGLLRARLSDRRLRGANLQGRRGLRFLLPPIRSRLLLLLDWVEPREQQQQQQQQRGQHPERLHKVLPHGAFRLSGWLREGGREGVNY